MEKFKIKKYEYSSHAVQRMFERKLNPDIIESVIDDWNIIIEYPTDKPFPSYIFLGYSQNEPIHI